MPPRCDSFSSASLSPVAVAGDAVLSCPVPDRVNVFIVIYHSSSLAPTRRVAVGENDFDSFGSDQIKRNLGPLLRRLFAVVAGQGDEVIDMIEDLERGLTPTSRLRCRIQKDKQGLKSTEIFFSDLSEPEFVPATTGISSQQILLGVIMAVNGVEDAKRRSVLRWVKAVASGFGEDVEGEVFWAREVLGFTSTEEVTEAQIKSRFRETLREVHPDGGKNAKGWLVDELIQARKTLMETKNLK